MSLQLSTLPKFNVPQPLATSAGSATSVTWPWTPLDVAWLKFLNSHQASTHALHAASRASIKAKGGLLKYSPCPTWSMPRK